MVLWTLPAIAAEAGGLLPFDLRPTGYSAEEARTFLAALSDEGRAIYAGPQRALDGVYPALLAAVLAGAVKALFRRGPLRVVLMLAVLGGMLADYAENLRIAAMLAAGPEATDAMIEAASRATVTKSALTGAVMGLVLLALARRLRRKWRG
ncbi:hypothetical protein [Jhaorihella thermophila]|uniref:Uncharacterized protein n=1 Tax=Jhaorihella thermophila TaxID=488547 RepID=A0A1H5TGM8_9RHOB|nr:hypothetical protein [Jhaorihella thermophila]SEF61913.1 hypothetical protein SAMN05421751_102265 [Jhaorihella thermophila]